MLEVPDDWTSAYNDDGISIIKRAKNSLLKTFTPAAYPMLYSVINRKQRTAYHADLSMLAVYKELLEEGATVFKHTNHLLSVEERSGMLMEARAVLRTAEYVGNNSFYHIYQFDFRGRIYPSSGYFHEQGADHAKSMIRLANKVPLGENGYAWLLYAAAGLWGEDKLPMAERVEFASSHLDEWLTWAFDPLANREWFSADKPWSFLAVIKELLKVQIHGDREGFESGLLVYFDGSVNGSQHLAALSRDDTIAEYVNLVASDKPGDLYTLISAASFAQVEADYDQSLDDLFNEIHGEFKVLFQALNSAPNQSAAGEAWHNIRTFLVNRSDDIEAVKANFWSQPGVEAVRRKVTKRNVMTIGYGSAKKGFSNQLTEDSPKLLDSLKYMAGPWSWYMASLNYENCLDKLPGPTSMLALFKQLAVRANDADVNLAWTVPGTGFPATQGYQRAEVKRIDCVFMGRRFEASIRLPESMILNKSKQKSGAAPNIVHSYDAAHLAMTCDACEFETVTVHDSFGSAAGNSSELFEIVREQWAAFYELDPLQSLLIEQDAMDLMPHRGTLDHRAILESEFAFA
jgi:DNA-directed RNA polymerase